MKNSLRILAFATIAATAFTACNKEQQVDTPANNENVKRAYTFAIGDSTNGTKTVLASDEIGKFAQWEAGDYIGSITTKSAAYSDVTPADGETPATFTIWSEGGLDAGDKITVWAPYRKTQTVATNVSLTIPAEQVHLSDGKFDFDAMPMVAKQITVTEAMKSATDGTVIGTIYFANMGSVLNFKVFSTNGTYATEKVKAVVFNAGANVGGTFTKNLATIDPDDESTMGITFTSPVTSIKTSPYTAAAIGATSGTALDLYMVVAPGTYTGSVVVKTDAADYTYTLTNKTFVRSGIKAFGLDLGSATAVRTTPAPTTSSWVKTDITDLNTNDVIAIVDETTKAAMANSGGTKDAPSSISVTISDNKITSDVGSTLQWVFEKPSMRLYKFKKIDSSDYLYTTSNNDGVRVGTNTDNTFYMEWNNDNNAYFLVNNSTSRYLGVYTTNSEWRCYTSVNNNIKGTKVAFYKKEDVDLASHSINITNPTNGTVVTSHNGNAYETSIVTIITTPSDGYAVATVSVKDASNNDVATTKVDATHYTFSMPTSDATVTVTFAQLYTITTSATNGTILVSPAATAIAGEEITITASPNAGYAFSEWTVTGADPVSTSTNPTTFTMPSGNVSVSATFVSAKTITRLIEKIDDVAAAGTDSGSLVGAYSLANATDEDLTVTVDGTVVTEASASGGNLTYKVAANTGLARSGSITIAVDGGNSITIAVNQLAGKTKYTITWNSTNNSQGVSSYSNSWYVTADGLRCDMTNWNNNNNGWSYVKCGSKSSAYTATIITHSAISQAIKSIDLNIGATNTTNVTSIKVYVSDESTFDSTAAGTFTNATGKQTVNLTPASNKFYKIEVVCAKSSNGVFQLNELVFNF